MRRYTDVVVHLKHCTSAEVLKKLDFRIESEETEVKQDGRVNRV